MKRLFFAICLLCLPFALLSGLSGVSRAQSWKPVDRKGSQELALDEVKFLIVPETKNPNFLAAIADLQRLYAEEYGRELEVKDVPRAKQAIYFEQADIGEGGAFSIVRERTKLRVRGADEAAWANGIYALAAEFFGARWYWAGDLGFERVESRMVFFPNRPWIEQPAFVQRQFYPVNNDFGRRNRLNRVYSFNHNLAKVFSPELFAERPELFAEVNGRRKEPRGSGGTDPQPDLTEPGAVEVAARAALEHFENNPESTSFSLSINDNVLFDTTEATEAVVTPLRYFRERPDYTDLVFEFTNQVAERVFEEAGAWQTPLGEDRYLTALSYYWTEPSPTIQIHPRVMPVLTSDRAQWHDPAYRKEDKQLISEWVESGAERVATWDYYFGAPYLYPRQFNEWIDESLKHLSREGVDVFFSQLPSFWGLDGAKAWLAAELLWNPSQDATVLLNEFYDNFFGNASKPMRAFYETAERYRNTYEGKADWIKLYKDESGIALFNTEVLKEMRGYIKAAQSNVEPGSRFAQRVEVVSQAFQLTELYAAYDQTRRDLVSMCIDPGIQSKGRVEMQLELFRSARSEYRSYLEEFLTTAYAPARRRIDLGQSNPEAFALGVINGVQARHFFSLSRDPNLTHHGYEMRNFLGPELPVYKDWNLDYRASEDFAVIESETGQEGSGLRIENADIVSVFSVFPVVSEKEYVLRLKGSWQINLDNRIHIRVLWTDRNGDVLSRYTPLRLPYGSSSGLKEIHLPLTAPSHAYNLRIRVLVSRQYPGDFFDIQELDFGVWR